MENIFSICFNVKVFAVLLYLKYRPCYALVEKDGAVLQTPFCDVCDIFLYYIILAVNRSIVNCFLYYCDSLTLTLNKAVFFCLFIDFFSFFAVICTIKLLYKDD